ncbi:Response regulator receiver domain-containing protein [Leifsonia sp. 98AMF]|jgi:DNA-binding response OmpR family regulator|uniref:response regulator n=1 Tax=unclassified Leifsonia TaxID=2663824 RepID=UPI00087CDCF3|nr:MULTISPECIES: response regulator [unclassified Leifsonia]SDH27524.1 Response regulator receiver domain-containing protein [Leifsonia sp. 197AMF]SDJ11042.1 Response regulator receiver domain-containing protein [Leifsonia sp. 466MF]SDJ59103.1 Response regulator receiver domain-containing protein [Leifsonia sp. 157MF]SDN32336.1 Response regulator receiver domain-containing protein [Leifsonia sp. 509MF]SEM89144.1 Response regulator receiver domain-containing protein [Leifsonia sp. 467MF]
MSERKRIVIADDDDDIRNLMAIAANRAGVDIVAAVDNGSAALAAVQAGGIDLAVLDISMPGLNGVEVAEAIRADDITRSTLILMVSASVQLLTDHGVVADRSDSFIVKPFSPRVLSTRIREMLELGEPA